MTYYSPTVVFAATIGLELITVTDTNGTYYLQVYRLSGNRTFYEYGETWSDGSKAIEAAEALCREKL